MRLLAYQRVANSCTVHPNVSFPSFTKSNSFPANSVGETFATEYGSNIFQASSRHLIRSSMSVIVSFIISIPFHAKIPISGLSKNLFTRNYCIITKIFLYLQHRPTPLATSASAFRPFQQSFIKKPFKASGGGWNPPVFLTSFYRFYSAFLH